jgi:hypothetical protein
LEVRSYGTTVLRTDVQYIVFKWYRAVGMPATSPSLMSTRLPGNKRLEAELLPGVGGSALTSGRFDGPAGSVK